MSALRKFIEYKLRDLGVKVSDNRIDKVENTVRANFKDDYEAQHIDAVVRALYKDIISAQEVKE